MHDGLIAMNTLFHKWSIVFSIIFFYTLILFFIFQTKTNVIWFHISIVAFILIITLILLSIKNVYLGYLLLIILLLFQQYFIFKRPFAATAYNIWLIIIFLITFFKHHSKVNLIFLNKSRLINYVLLCLSFLIIITTASMIYHPLNIAIKMLFNFVGIALLILITLIIINDDYKINIVLKILLGIVVLNALVAILQTFHLMPQLWHYQADRFGVGFAQSAGIVGSRGTNGMLLNSGIAVVLKVLFIDNVSNRKKFLYFGLFLLLLLAVIISQSRSTYLSILICLSCFAIFYLVMIRNAYQKLFLMCFFFLFILLFFFNYGNEMNSIVHFLHQASERGVVLRISSLDNIINALKSSTFNLLFGLGEGLQDREILFYRHQVVDVAVHNGFAIVARYGGIITLIPYITLIICSFICLLRIMIQSEYKSLRYNSLVIFSALSGCLIELNFYMGTSEKVFWHLIGISYALYLMLLSKKGGKSLATRQRSRCLQDS